MFLVERQQHVLSFVCRLQAMLQICECSTGECLSVCFPTAYRPAEAHIPTDTIWQPSDCT
eukprot:581561-Amphidinium_carterae.1